MMVLCDNNYSFSILGEGRKIFEISWGLFGLELNVSFVAPLEVTNSRIRSE